MIVFEGKLNAKSRNSIIRYFFKRFCIVNLIMLIVFGLPSLIIYLNSDVWFFLVAYCGCPLSFLLLFVELKKVIPVKITINEETIELCYLNGKKDLTYIDLVEKIVDKQESFELKFSNPSEVVICQKDLIAEGTIEEFEEIFKDKIVRKTK